MFNLAACSPHLYKIESLLPISFLQPLDPSRGLGTGTGKGQGWVCVTRAELWSENTCKTLWSLSEWPYTGGSAALNRSTSIRSISKLKMPRQPKRPQKKGKSFFPMFEAKNQNIFIFISHWFLKIV